MRKKALATAVAIAAGVVLTTPAGAADDERATRVRFATFNASLTRPVEGQLARDLGAPDGDRQAAAVAKILKRADADVVLVSAFDQDPAALEIFQDQYLSQDGGEALYPYAYTSPVNAGVPSGHDLNNDGAVGGPRDALGPGRFPGQVGMVLFSKYPIDEGAARTFQTFLWKDMPGARLPEDPATGEPWYSSEELEGLPLSSTSHWDVPVQVDDTTVHVLASHPADPSADGPEQLDARRNHDEIRFWADYVTGGRSAAYITDDDGASGGLRRGSEFVIMGTLNADPFDGEAIPGTIDQLLDHSRLQDPEPTSKGAVEAALTQGGANTAHRGDPALDTADFTEPGNLRVDYVLPSEGLRVANAKVFWPEAHKPASAITYGTSDHRLVWADVHVGR